MSKKKGDRTERELFHMFWEEGIACSRVAGSGSTPRPSPDLIAVTNNQSLAIECKSGKGRRYLKEKEVDELKYFGRVSGANLMVATRFDNEDWFFLKPEELGKGKGKNFYVDLNHAKKHGITFKELIKKFKQKKL